VGDTKIEWATKTWNPIRGCTRISAGCTSCYAEAFAARFSDPGQPYHEIARRGPNGPRWTGKLMVVSKVMDDPARWRKPQRVFVNSMSDLFHERLPPEAIARIFRAMINVPRHVFMVLTKRAQRMCEWVEAFEQERGEPLPAHIQLGVSAEDQPNADERLAWLAKTRATIRFVSAEPLLGPIDFSPWLEWLSWVIFGGESGYGCRPYDVDWARRGIAQLHAAGRPAFHKQLGGAPFDSTGAWESRDVLPLHGPDISEWDPDFAVREFPA